MCRNNYKHRPLIKSRLSICSESIQECQTTTTKENKSVAAAREGGWCYFFISKTICVHVCVWGEWRVTKCSTLTNEERLRLKHGPALEVGCSCQTLKNCLHKVAVASSVRVFLVTHIFPCFINSARQIEGSPPGFSFWLGWYTCTGSFPWRCEDAWV